MCKRLFCLLVVSVTAWTKNIVFDGRSVFALTDTAIVQYDRSSHVPVGTIGFFGKPVGIDSGNALYLLTSRGLFKANPLTGRFVDIFPLYEFPQAMFFYKNSIDLITQNELLVFDCAGKLKVKLGVFLEPAERIGTFSAPDGRLFLAKDRGGLEIFEEGKRQLKMLSFPAGVTKIIAAGNLLYCAAKREVLAYDWTKGKTVKRLPISESIVDIAFGGNALAISTERELAVVDIAQWRIVKKETSGGRSRLAIAGDQLFASQGKKVLVFALPGLTPGTDKNFTEPVREFLYDPESQAIVALGKNDLLFEGIVTRSVLQGIAQGVTQGVAQGVTQSVTSTESVKVGETSAVAASKSADSLFAIQVGAFGSNTNAENLGSALNNKGIAYYIVEDKGVFKVRVGYFNSKQDAQVAVTGLNDYKPWIARDKVNDSIKAPVGFDVNRDGNPEWVLNAGDRVIIFSLEKNVYKKIWESPAEKKLKATGIGEGKIEVETPAGKKGTVRWSGKQWELRF